VARLTFSTVLPPRSPSRICARNDVTTKLTDSYERRQESGICQIAKLGAYGWSVERFVSRPDRAFSPLCNSASTFLKMIE